MSLSCGIIGLPNVVKSTIFNALTSAGAQVGNYPFCTIAPQQGIVQVPDVRLDKLAALLSPPKIVPSSVEIVDIAGLVKGASQGEGLGNQFLGHIREVDAIVHIVRCFESPDVALTGSAANPADDIEIINTELLLADLQTVENKVAKLKRQTKFSDKRLKEQLQFYEQVLNKLSCGNKITYQQVTTEESVWLSQLQLLSTKPVIYIANLGEDFKNSENKSADIVHELARAQGAFAINISAKLEEELSQLDTKERLEFQAELGLEQSGTDKIIKACYDMLGLITFFTACTGGKEIRAWPIVRGTSALLAAGEVHTDMMRGFIRCEVIHYDDFISLGSEHAAKDKGLVYIEGKDYLIQDGDILLFRFNV